MANVDGKRPADAALNAEIDRFLGLDLPADHHLHSATASLGSGDVEGDLADTEFLLLLGRAFVSAFSGCLRLRGPEGDLTVWFSAGLPIDVVPSTLSIATRASTTAAAVERRLFDVATWRDGRFIFQPLSATGSEVHRIHALRHPATLAYEVLARRDADPALAIWRGDSENRFRLRWPLATDIVAGLEPELRVAVRLFDGGRTFAEVVKGSRLGDARILKAAFLLFCFGVLVPANDETSALFPPFDEQARADRDRIEALSLLAEEGDYFNFLGVDRQASRHEILAAADRLRREIIDETQHLDVAVATGRQRLTIAEVLAEAVRVLGDDDLRRRYRAALIVES